LIQINITPTAVAVIYRLKHAPREVAMAVDGKSSWNSLEIAKLFVAVLTPITVALVGYFVQQQLASQNLFIQQQLAIQNRDWQAQQRLLERRLQVYDQIRNGLNRIYCFVEDVGTWKEETPQSVIRYKRDLDGIMFPHEALWGTDTFSAYTDYMTAAFATYQGIGKDAKIRTSDRQKAVGVVGWKPDWGESLTGERDPEHNQTYNKLISLISRDLSFPSTMR
jgi:hypothetical protein